MVSHARRERDWRHYCLTLLAALILLLSAPAISADDSDPGAVTAPEAAPARVRLPLIGGGAALSGANTGDLPAPSGVDAAPLPASAAVIPSPSAYGIPDPALIPNPQAYAFADVAAFSTPATFPGGTLSAGVVRLVGISWATWNPQVTGYHVVYTESSIYRITFAKPQNGVAVKVEPNVSGPFPITATALDMDGLAIGSYTRNVSGNAGAAFLGFLSPGGAIKELVLTAPSAAGGFAFSDITWGTGAVTVAYSVDSDGAGNLYVFNLALSTGAAIGQTGFADIESLTFTEDGNALFGIDDSTDQLVRCDISTGACSAIGGLGVGIIDTGLTMDSGGRLLMSTDFPANLYSVDPASGAATLIGAQGQRVTGLADGRASAACQTGIYGLGGDHANNLGCVDPATGAFTAIGPLGALSLSDGGIDFDGEGILWGLRDTSGMIFTLNPATGAATVAGYARNPTGQSLAGFEGLAVSPLGGARVIGWVFEDTDRDGIRDPGETGGPANISVHLTRDGFPFDFAHTTPSSGWYSFEHVGRGEYCVSVTLPPALAAAGATESCVTITGSDEVVNFGVLPARAAIGGVVFRDLDADGIQDTADPGVEGISVALRVNGFTAPSHFATTDSEGAYRFDSIVPGEYLVEVTDTGGLFTGLAVTTQRGNPLGAISVGNEEYFDAANFGFGLVCGPGRGAISGRVWRDQDADGLQGADEEGIAGVPVCAEPLGWGPISCVLSGATGHYGQCVAPATYLVAVDRTGEPLVIGAPTTPQFYLPVVVSESVRFDDGFFGYRRALR